MCSDHYYIDFHDSQQFKAILLIYLVSTNHDEIQYQKLCTAMRNIVRSVYYHVHDKIQLIKHIIYNIFKIQQ